MAIGTSLLSYDVTVEKVKRAVCEFLQRPPEFCRGFHPNTVRQAVKEVADDLISTQDPYLDVKEALHTRTRFKLARNSPVRIPNETNTPLKHEVNNNKLLLLI